MLDTDTMQVTQELLALLSEIDEFKGAWRSLGTIESIGSSTRIEGSKLTDREVERLLGNLEIKRFSTRDEQEVAGYAEVMEPAQPEAEEPIQSQMFPGHWAGRGTCKGLNWRDAPAK
jgi:hypothetical protein